MKLEGNYNESEKKSLKLLSGIFALGIILEEIMILVKKIWDGLKRIFEGI